MIPANVDYKQYCKDCPYLVEGKKKEWLCDLAKDLKCSEQYFNCWEEEQEFFNKE